VRDNTNGIYRRASDGTGKEERLYQHPTGAAIVLTDWSADGRFLCFWSGDTMFVLPGGDDRGDQRGERKPIELRREDFFGRGGRFSPDGRLLAFNSNQSGRFQIYVRPLGSPSIAGETSSPAASGDAARLQVSNDGGIGGIVWRKDGRELFYLSQPPRQTVMAVEVTAAPTFEARAPRPLFEIPTPIVAPAQLSSVSSPDGQRFVFAVNVPSRPAR
jgi:hypothetical protein